MTPQPSSKPSRLAAIALAMVTVLSLTACTGHGAKDATATTRPVAADPVITWQGTTPTPPTDPRALAVWNYMIEGAYAYNTKDYRRQQLADTATREKIRGLIRANAVLLADTQGYSMHQGPTPVAIRSVKDTGGSSAVVEYCYVDAFWWVYGEPFPTRPEEGWIYAYSVVRGSDGRWRVDESATVGDSGQECSMADAAYGYFDPLPKPEAPGTYSVSQLMVPSWAKVDK